MHLNERSSSSALISCIPTLVAQTLSLSSSAKVKGKVQVEKLAVEPGAEINGSVSMGALMKKALPVL